MMSGQKRNNAFKKTVLSFYRTHGRKHLPWRSTRDPYRILVSELMLQQTQVDRVIPYYKAFLKQFPTMKRLAAAKLPAVLKLWQGLGYNRRGKMLHDVAKTVMSSHKGVFPKTYADLVALPGIGPYTARAIRTFAYNEPEVLIETNIRTVYLHHFFPKKKKVTDSELLQLIVTPKDVGPREWYAALMDYGSHLKKTVPNPSRRSAHHTKQKPFKGSDREIRGAILRARLTGVPLLGLPFERKRIAVLKAKLRKEGLL